MKKLAISIKSQDGNLMWFKFHLLYLLTYVLFKLNNMNDPEQYHSWDFSLVTHALNVIQAQRMTTHNSAKWNRAEVGST